MKALKSPLAKELLSNVQTAEQLRRAVEFAVSSRALKSSKTSQSVVEIPVKAGGRKTLRAQVVSPAK